MLRPYQRLDELDRMVVAAQVKDFREYVGGLRRQIQTAIAPPKPRRMPKTNPAKDYNVLPGEIIAFLRKNKQASMLNLTQGLGRPQASLKDAIRRMVDRGQVEKVKVGERNVMYQLTEG